VVCLVVYEGWELLATVREQLLGHSRKVGQAEGDCAYQVESTAAPIRDYMKPLQYALKKSDRHCYEETHLI
jgi:hypothetical protein